MAWPPTGQEFRKIITARAIPINLVDYCLNATRQREALTWAGGAATLRAVKTSQNSLAERDKPIYPCIAFSDDEDAQDAEDLITAVYQVTLELRIQNSDPDTAVTDGRVYSKAFCSMIVNCPVATLLTNTGASSGRIESMETKFVAIKAHSERKNDFRQDIQIGVTYVLYTSTL